MTSPDACPSCAALISGASSLLRLRLSFPFAGSRLVSLHQTPIGDLSRSAVAAPCPGNTSVPSLVQSNASWLFVQLAPGSRKGQSSLEERTSAPHGCSEGRWVSNQGERMPGRVQEAIACFAVLATIPDLRISSEPHDAGFALGSRNRLQLDGWITHPRSFQVRARKRSLSNARSLLSMK